MPVKRQIVNVMRPPDALNTRGLSQGQPETVYKNLPCEIKDTTSREVVQARTVFAEANYVVKLYGDPSKQILERDYLTGGSLGERKFGIISVADAQQNGINLTLICGERTGG